MQFMFAITSLVDYSSTACLINLLYITFGKFCNRFHVVPNKLLVSDDLGSLPVGTVLPTMDGGRNLEVTTAEEGEEPMRINYVRIKKFDIMHNSKIAVHCLSMPFSHFKPSPPHKSARSVDNQTVDLAPSPEIDRKKKLDL